MVKTILGILLIVFSCLLIITFISRGLLFPHLFAPIALGVVGIVLLAFKRKAQ